MSAMLLLALFRPPREARFGFICTLLASFVRRVSLRCFPLIRKGLLRLSAHGWLLERLRRISLAPFGILREFGFVRLLVPEERKSLPSAYHELQDLFIGRLHAEDDAGNAVLPVFNMLYQSHPELAVMIHGQGGRHADLHGSSI